MHRTKTQQGTGLWQIVHAVMSMHATYLHKYTKQKGFCMQKIMHMYIIESISQSKHFLPFYTDTMKAYFCHRHMLLL